jgi:chromosome segregation ATPase
LAAEAREAHAAVMADLSATVAARNEAERDMAVAQGLVDEAQQARQEAEAEQRELQALVAQVQAQQGATEAEVVALRASRDEQAAMAQRTSEDAERTRAASQEALLHAERAKQQAELMATAARRKISTQILVNRDLLLNALGRMIRRELNEARANATSLPKFTRWLERFPAVHTVVYVDALKDAVRSHVTMLDRPDEALTLTEQMARDHIARFVELLSPLATLPIEEFQGDLERCLERWEQTQAAAVADTLVQQEIDHVRI